MKSATACSTQELYNQSCWSDYFCSRIAETIVFPAMRWEFYLHGNSEAPTIPTSTSTWATGVGLSRQWPVPHKNAKISNVEVIAFVAESPKTIVPSAMHWEFYLHGNSEAPTVPTSTSTWATGVGLSRQWPVPHKKAIISHVEVITFVAESPKLSFLQQCIENFTSMAVPKHLLTRRALQHEQLCWD